MIPVEHSKTERQAQQARGVLRALYSTGGIRSVGLVSPDGLMIAAVMSGGVDTDRFSAMSASLLALSSRASREVECGELRQIILDGQNGPVLLTRAGEGGVLAVAADPTSKLGKLILDTRDAAQKIASLGILDGP